MTPLGLSISHETIYAIIRKDKRQGGDLYKNCRHQLKHRARPVGGRLFSIPNRVSIDERPKEADGKRFGDFEMDTIVGKKNMVPLSQSLREAPTCSSCENSTRVRMPRHWLKW